MWRRSVIKALLLKDFLVLERAKEAGGSNANQSSTVFLFQSSQVEAATSKCNEYTVESGAGKLTCFTCHTCPVGFGLFPQCGTRIKDNETKNQCKPYQYSMKQALHMKI